MQQDRYTQAEREQFRSARDFIAIHKNFVQLAEQQCAYGILLTANPLEFMPVSSWMQTYLHRI
jgi:hypothetical protein